MAGLRAAQLTYQMLLTSSSPYVLLNTSPRFIARSAAMKQSSFFSERRYGLLRGACHRARIRATRWLAMTMWVPLPRALIERLAHGDIALLLRGPVAAAGDGAIDHQIVPVDETGFVAGEKHRGIGDVFGQPGALDRLCGLVDLAHHIGRLLRRLYGKTQRLAEDAGGDRAR